MNIKLLTKLLNFYPPFIGSGVRVAKINNNYSDLTIKMKLRFYNKNIRGVHFGGSLYSMCDPWYMLIIQHHLGDNYVVWDKSANIRFRRPGKGTVYARFTVSKEQLENIKQQVDTQEQRDFNFQTNVVDEHGENICIVDKVIYVNTVENYLARRKNTSNHSKA